MPFCSACGAQHPDGRTSVTGAMGLTYRRRVPKLSGSHKTPRLDQIVAERWELSVARWDRLDSVPRPRRCLRPKHDAEPAEGAYCGQDVAGMGFDDVSLLLFYNLAAIYNSPADTPLHPLEGFVEDAKQVITDSAGPFNRVFLYMALVPGKVYQLR
jgi:hypothetical protein